MNFFGLISRLDKRPGQLKVRRRINQFYPEKIGALNNSFKIVVKIELHQTRSLSRGDIFAGRRKIDLAFSVGYVIATLFSHYLLIPDLEDA